MSPGGGRQDSTGALLRDFLVRERADRENQRNERQVIRQTIHEMGNAIASMQAETIRMGARIDSVEKDVAQVVERVDGLESDTSDLSEQTGRHEVAALQAELKLRDEALLEVKESRKHWTRTVAASFLMFLSGLGVAWFGAHYKGCVPGSAQAAPPAPSHSSAAP